MSAFPASGNAAHTASLGSMSPAFVSELDVLFRQRRDVRRFLSKPVDDDLVDEIVATSLTAPSVGLSEPTRFLRLQSQGIRKAVLANFETANAQALGGYDGDQAQLYASLKLQGLQDAPIQLAAFCDTLTTKGAGLGSRTMPEALAYSSVCAIMAMWLAATARGLGLGWVSIFDVASLTETLNVPQHWSFVGCLCLGWPEEYHLDPELERAGWKQRTMRGPHIELR